MGKKVAVVNLSEEERAHLENLVSSAMVRTLLGSIFIIPSNTAQNTKK